MLVEVSYIFFIFPTPPSPPRASQVSQILLVIWSGIFFYIPWAEMFGSRPALHQKPEGESLVLLGFSRIRTTVAQMKTDYNAVFVLLCAIAFAEAGKRNDATT